MRVFIVLALLGAVCALPRQATRIVGGSPTTIAEYPFMSAMLLNTWMGLRQFCGGTLITNRAVVSAAHCYSGASVSNMRVRLGSSYASSGGSVIAVARVNSHRQYNAQLLINDIAVVRLSSAAQISSQIDVARIAGPQYSLADNTRLFTAGWGETSYQGRPSETLLHVEVNAINQRICAERYAFLKSQPGMSRWPDVTPEMLCTGILDVGGKDACQGDSGGPVIHNRDVLVGITSWGYECAHAVYPGVNVRVSSYTSWIESNSN